MALLTIVIPTYGEAKYLDSCLDSIKCQKEGLTECIISDGGSKFDFFNYSWISCRRMVPDPGMVKCWSIAASSSRTQYISFLADDNILEAKFASKMIDFLEQGDYDLVFCNQLFINEGGTMSSGLTEKLNTFYGRSALKKGLVPFELYNHLIRKNSIPLEACIIKKRLWEEHGPFYEKAEGAFDLHFLYKIILAKHKIGFLPEYLMRFRLHDHSYTNIHQEKHTRGTIWALEDLLRLTSNTALEEKLFIHLTKLLNYSIPHEEKIRIRRKLLSNTKGLHSFFKWKIRSLIQTL